VVKNPLSRVRLPGSGKEARTQPPADARPSAPRARSPLLAATLSFAFPGAGQLYLGRRIAAAVFAIPAVLVIVWAVLQLSQGLMYFAASMLDESYALTVTVVVAAFTAWRVAAIAHPFLVMRPRRIGKGAAAVLAALLLGTVGMGNFVFSDAFDAYNADRQMASNAIAVDATDAPDQFEWGPITSQTVAPWASDWPTDEPEATDTPAPSCPPSYTEAVTARRVSSGDLAAAPEAAAPLALTEVPSPGTAAPEAGSEEPSATAEPTPTPGPTASPEATSSESPSASPEGSPEASPSESPSASPSPSPTASMPINPRRLTVLLVGVDYLSGRNHALTDTLMLVSVNLDTRAVAMVSVPRDTAAFPFYWGGDAPTTFKINGLVKAIAAGRFGSPDTPMVTLANEIGYLVGVHVDYYAAIDMQGFVDLVDLVGGVDIYNPTVLNDPSSCTYVPVGNVHLDGTMALHYVRSRESTNDYYRASRQQRVMIALKDKMATPAIVTKLGSLLSLAGKSIATNFPLKTAKNYVKTAERISSISHCVLGPPYNYHPDSKLTGGSWTSRLKLDQVANLSVYLFGADSRYYGQPGVTPAPCQNRY
jgi:LCP family protein required for cell wall assembly